MPEGVRAKAATTLTSYARSAPPRARGILTVENWGLAVFIGNGDGRYPLSSTWYFHRTAPSARGIHRFAQGASSFSNFASMRAPCSDGE